MPNTNRTRGQKFTPKSNDRMRYDLQWEFCRGIRRAAALWKIEGADAADEWAEFFTLVLGIAA